MPRCYLGGEKAMDVMTIAYKFNNLSATGDALVYRARRIFHIVCMWLGCGIASILRLFQAVYI